MGDERLSFGESLGSLRKRERPPCRGESDFHALRSEQRLLVDFQSFPEQLADLLRRCSEAEWESSAASAGGRAKQEPGSSKMLASLDAWQVGGYGV